MKQIINDIKEAVIQANKVGTSSYDTQAEVIRVEGSTLWVHIPGGVDETPVAKTVNAKEGDIVQVRVGNGRAWLVGNASAPPTDDTTAVQASRSAKAAVEDAAAAHDAAESAQKSAASAQASATTAYNAAQAAQTSANNALVSAQNASEYAARALGNLSTVQSVSETLTWITQHGTMALTTDVALDPTHVYFVVDAGGDYTVGGVTYAIVTEPDVDDIGTYYELTIDESLNNYVGTHLALTSEGLWLLPASSGTNKVLVATGAGSVYTTAGTYILDSSGGTVASFRANGATIGEVLNGLSRTEIDSTGFEVIYRNSGNDVKVAKLGYTTESSSNSSFCSLGTRTETAPLYDSTSTYSIGDLCTLLNGIMYVCNTNITTPEAFNNSHWDYAIGDKSVVTGDNCVASGDYSFASGKDCKALGDYSHAEGYNTLAWNTASHAEGQNTKVWNGWGHAEGQNTEAGRYAHAEGFASQAMGYDSHAQNYSTIAQRKSQTAIGEYNVADTTGADETARGEYALIIGNGTAGNARSNALTVDWSGNVNIPTGANYCINNVPISGGGGGGDVTGVKGNAEVSYRTGNVNLTPANIGAIDTAGTGLTKSSTTLNHSNSITAQTTQAVYPIKIDAQGHISAYGSAVTIPTVNNATLTIQKNSSTVATFTANASSAVTADISVPTDTSDLTNGAGFITSGDIPAIHNVPSGGTSGQVLTKNSNTDYDLTWTTPGGGGGVTLPIGAVYESINSTDPSSDLGNTWTYIGTADMNGISLVTSDGDGIITSDGDLLESVRVTYKFARTA